MGKFPPTSEKPTWIHLKIPHGQHISKKVLKRAGFAEIWVYPNIVDQHTFIKNLQQRLQDQYTQAWQSELRNTIN